MFKLDWFILFEEEGTSAQDSSTVEQTAEVTFTQKDLDRIVAKRVKEVNGKFSDYDNLKGENTSLLEKISGLEQEVKDKQATLASKALENEISRVSQSMGLDPILAAKLLDNSKLHFDDNGKPTNLSETLTEIVTTFPQLVRKAPANQPIQEDSKTSDAPKFSLNPSRASNFFQGSGILFKE